MNKTILKMPMHKKVMFLSFLILYSLFLSANAFSRTYWNPANSVWNPKEIRIGYDRVSNKVRISFYYIYYYFGPFGERAYFERADFKFSSDGLHYDRLFSCEVEDQVPTDTARITFKHKYPGSKIMFENCYIPSPQTEWADDKNIHAKTKTNKFLSEYETSIDLNIEIPDCRIKDIEMSGILHVNGLNCNIEIVGEKYEISYPGDIESKLKYSKGRPDDKAIKVFKKADAVVIKGVDRGEDIRFYTSSGTQIYSTIATDDILTIKLPANQMYIVRVGQVRYKIP